MVLSHYYDLEIKGKQNSEAAIFLEERLSSMDIDELQKSLEIKPIYPRIIASNKPDYYSFQGLLYELEGVTIGNSLFSYVPQNIERETKELFWEEFYPLSESDEILDVLQREGLGTLVHCASLIKLVEHLKLTPEYLVSHSQDPIQVSNSRISHLKKMNLVDGENPVELFPIVNYINRSLRYARKNFGFKFENPMDRYFSYSGELVLSAVYKSK